MITSTVNLTGNQAFTIRRAFDLCEIAEYGQAASLLPTPDLESSDAELLFVWGVISSGQGDQELAKDLLSKAARLLDNERAELARVHLSLCYWRIDEVSEALVLLSIQPEGTEARFCCLLVRAIIDTERGNYHAALALLAEVNLSGLSDPKRGKFHNHKGLALRKLGKNEQAIQEFEQAISCWKDAPELLALAKNNLARAYSLSGRLEDALASVDAAISLTTSRQRLGQFLDQKSKICLDHALPAEAKIASDNAVLLLRGTEREDFLTEALVTQKASFLLSPPPNRPQNEGDSMSQPLARSHELIQAMIRDNDAQFAPELIELMYRVGGPDNPETDKELRGLFARTPEFEDAFQTYLKQFDEPDVTSEAPS